MIPDDKVIRWAMRKDNSERRIHSPAGYFFDSLAFYSLVATIFLSVLCLMLQGAIWFITESWCELNFTAFLDSLSKLWSSAPLSCNENQQTQGFVGLSAIFLIIGIILVFVFAQISWHFYGQKSINGENV